MLGPRATIFLAQNFSPRLRSALKRYFLQDVFCGKCHANVPFDKAVWCVHCGTTPTCSLPCMHAHIASGPSECSLNNEMTPHGLAIVQWYQKYGRMLMALIYTLANLKDDTPDQRRAFCNSYMVHASLGYDPPTPFVPRISTITYEGMAFNKLENQPAPANTSVLGSLESPALDIFILMDFGKTHPFTEALDEGYNISWRMRLDWPKELHDIPLERLKGLLAGWIADTAELDGL